VADEPRFQSFSVGVKPDINNQRRAVQDGIAKLAGEENRLDNHTMTFERLIFGVHIMMIHAPDSFAACFGGGGTQQEDKDTLARFKKWVREGAKFAVPKNGNRDCGA
jgi:hypothetical protein